MPGLGKHFRTLDPEKYGSTGRDTQGSGMRFSTIRERFWDPILKAFGHRKPKFHCYFGLDSRSLCAWIFALQSGRLGFLKLGFRIRSIATQKMSRISFLLILSLSISLFSGCLGSRLSDFCCLGDRCQKDNEKGPGLPIKKTGFLNATDPKTEILEMMFWTCTQPNQRTTRIPIVFRNLRILEILCLILVGRNACRKKPGSLSNKLGNLEYEINIYPKT